MYVKHQTRINELMAQPREQVSSSRPRASEKIEQFISKQGEADLTRGIFALHTNSAIPALLELAA